MSISRSAEEFRSDMHLLEQLLPLLNDMGAFGCLATIAALVGSHES